MSSFMIWYESRVALPKEFINTSTVNKEMTALLTCVEKWSTWWGQKCCSCMLVCNPPRSFKCVAVKLLSQGETVKTCQQPLWSSPSLKTAHYSPSWQLFAVVRRWLLHLCLKTLLNLTEHSYVLVYSFQSFSCRGFFCSHIITRQPNFGTR